jgi:PEP-CTERM motif
MKYAHSVALLSGLIFIALSGVAWAGQVSVGPEPTTLALLAAGVGGAALVKFRRRK